MNKIEQMYQEAKRILGHEPRSLEEVRGLVEDQYVKAKYGNEKAKQFINLVRAAKKEKPKKQYICMDCKEIVTVKIQHIREKHPGMLWFDGKLHGNIMQYMFMGVD